MTDHANLKTIRVERDGAVDWLTLNRPDRLNTLTGTMVEELCAYFDGLKHDYSVRVVVMRGAGRAFCAGLDIKEHLEATACRKARGALVRAITCSTLCG